MPKALDLKKDLEEKQKFSEANKYKRTSNDKAADEMFEDRKQYLQLHRKSTGIEDIWKSADIAYVPHKVSSQKKKTTLVSDDELGWRSRPVVLGSEDEWQEDSVPPNPYIKIQTALGIIVDNNPSAVMSPKTKKYQNNNLLIKNLYEDSWDTAMSKKVMLKPFVFNAAKYGMGVGRTYPLTITRTVRDLKKYVPEDTKKNEYSTQDFTYFNDVFRESLSPWNVWFDDCAEVGNPFSTNDVVYYKDYDWLKFERNFGHLQNFKYVKPTERVLGSEGQDEKSAEVGEGEGKNSKIQERVWFWENLDMDLLFIKTESGVVLVNEPLPQSPKNKRLSVYCAPWTMRNDKSIFGIGIYEAMRNDHKLYTKIRNMTMDQVVLSIYKEFFYSGTDSLEGDGAMKTRPGVGRQVSDAKNIKWNEVPAAGAEAWEAQDRIMERIDDATGVSKSLQGLITGSTAFEISQARESALKRMKIPLEHITDALESDAYISVGIIEDLYSVAKVRLMSEDKYIQPFEIDMYERDDGEALAEGRDYEYEFREVNLALEKKEGKFEQSEEKLFFNLTPDDLPWEGTIKVKGQSIIANSEILERSTTVEMSNLVIPLFLQPREIAEKPVREILKAYDKDPEDWMPDAWLVPPVPPAMAGMGGEEEQGNALFTDKASLEKEELGGEAEVAPTENVMNNLANSIETMGQK